LRAALNHVDHVEQKRLRREAVQKQNQINEQFKRMGNVQGNPQALKETIAAIDDMISKEQKKLEEIANRKKSRQQQPDDADGDEMLTG
jgi:predicted RNase H-like nuclease (RuvC/YqgF family)